MTANVTVIIPTIPPRRALLDRAAASVAAQTVPVSLIIEPDPDHTGSAATRNRALEKVATEHFLCLDDDDELAPDAVEVLVRAQRAAGADVVSGGARIPERPDHSEPGPPVPAGWLSPEFVTGRSVLHVTSLVRAELARECGGFGFRHDPGTGMMLDDYGFYCRLADAGATFWRVPETVLTWHVHGKNTSGRSDRW